MSLLTLFAGAASATPSATGWSPADVTLTASMRGDWLDAGAPLYTDTSANTLATADGDPIGAMPSGRAEDISLYASSLYKPSLNNMALAPSLLLGDATHNRAVRFANVNSNTLYPGGGATVQRGASTRAAGARIRVRPTGTVWAIGGTASTSGPGIGFATSGSRKWAVGVSTGSLTPSSSPVLLDTWQTIVAISDATGTRLYVDDPDVPAFTDAAMTPSSLAAASTYLHSTTSIGFDFRRSFEFGDIDLSEITVADAMAWLEGDQQPAPVYIVTEAGQYLSDESGNLLITR